jgi:hypothetical protein
VSALSGLAGAHGGRDDSGEEDEVVVHESDLRIEAVSSARSALAFGTAPSVVVPVTFGDALGSNTLYTATAPGFAPRHAGEPGTSRAPLATGTDVWLEVVAVDDGRALLRVGDAVLARPGDRVLLGVHRSGAASPLHLHPVYEMLLPAAPGSFGEATLAVRLTTSGGAYAPSAPLTLRLSNGHLPPPRRPSGAALRCQAALLASGRRAFLRATASVADEDPPASRRAERLRARCASEYGASQLAAYLGLAAARGAEVRHDAGSAVTDGCRRALVSGGATYGRTRLALVGTCVATARAAEIATATGVPVPTERVAAACTAPARTGGGALLDRLIAARTTLRDAVARRCAGELSREGVRHHLTAAGCRADELVAAAFPAAAATLATMRARPAGGGRPLHRYFPCVAGRTP